MNVSAITNFAGEVYLGTQYCRTDPVGCDAKEGCIFKVANDDNSHVVDCNTPGLPVASSGFDYVCCKVYENCWDGIDNDYDGYIDCADEDCNGGLSGDYPGRPQVCTNPGTGADSPLITAYCAINWSAGVTTFHPDCEGDPVENPFNNAFYCSFGLSDDPADDPGVCCPYGETRELVGGVWQCNPSDECGISPSMRCHSDFATNRTDFWAPVSEPNWLSEVYDTSANWCNTQVPDLFQPWETAGHTGSNGCCLIPKFGEINYWLDEDNVKVWG